MTFPKPMLAAASALSRSAAGSAIREERKRHRENDGIAGVGIAIGATDHGASIGRFDGGDGRTEINRNSVVAALRREKFDECAVAADDAPLRMISAIHPLVAKRQGARPLRIRRVVAFGHPFDRTP